MNSSTIPLRVPADEIWVSFLNVQTKVQSKKLMHTHSPNKSNKFNKRCVPESWWQLFSGNGKECDGGICATRDHNNIRNVLWNSKILCRVIQNTRHGMLTSGVMLFHDNAHLHMAADLAPSDYRLFTYQNWLGSQNFNSNEKLMERGWAHTRQTLTQAYKNLFVDTSALILALISSLTYVHIFLHNKIVFSLLVSLIAHWRLLSK